MAAFLVRGLALTDRLADPFSDDDESIFEADIEKLAAAGITLGCNPPANTMFCPEDNVTRGQMAAFLVRGMGYTETGGDLFTDDDSSTFEADINRLATAGVTFGCNPPTNDRFCPDALVTRGQMAAFLTRALDLTPIVPPPPVDGGGTLTVMFVAVRQGDAAVFVGACGETGLIDANRFRSAEVLTAIDSVGTRGLKWIANSHYDADHLGAVLDVATASGVTVDQFYDRGGGRTVKDSNTYRDYFDYVTAADKRTSLDIGGRFTLCSGIDEVTFTVVSAGTDGTAAGGVAVSDENDRGLCIHVEYYDFDLAMCGDSNGTSSGSRTDVESAVAGTI
jgi:glyoxylase-like metal-dependent hydrolase (beta-lactamase superfamily II)